MYGRMAKMPQNCMMKHWNAIKMNGFSVRLRPTSFNFSQSVGGGCTHLVANFSQFKHELDIALYRCRSLNSPETAAGDTQPRSHCSDFIASSSRALDSNHIGVSGTYSWSKMNFSIIRVYHCKGQNRHLQNKQRSKWIMGPLRKSMRLCAMPAAFPVRKPRRFPMLQRCQQTTWVHPLQMVH